jgi:hypothetical protein
MTRLVQPTRLRGCLVRSGYHESSPYCKKSPKQLCLS